MHKIKSIVKSSRAGSTKNKIKKRRIIATFIAWVNNVNNVRRIYGENRDGLVKEAERILEEITPVGKLSRASLWRNGKVIANIKFHRKFKR